MEAATAHGKRGVTEKVKDIRPTHSALAPHVPASGVFSPPSCVPDYGVALLKEAKQRDASMLDRHYALLPFR